MLGSQPPGSAVLLQLSETEEEWSAETVGSCIGNLYQLEYVQEINRKLLEFRAKTSVTRNAKECFPASCELPCKDYLLVRKAVVAKKNVNVYLLYLP